MPISWRPILSLLGFTLVLPNTGCQTHDRLDLFSGWPPGASPGEVGTRVAQNFADRKFEFESGKRKYVIYPEVCAWYGALTFTELAGDTELHEKLVRKFDPFLTTEAGRISRDAHVDFCVFGVVPLEIYIQTHDPKYLELGKGFADRQWEQTTLNGITAQARYWVDDMFMITALQVQAFRATGDDKYLDRAVLTMSAYLDRLQQPNGLFFHTPDSPEYWGRGNGWVAAGMAELLRSLPKTHPRYRRILSAYQKMMAALLRYQGQDGLWHQLIDHPEAWDETSGTGMFTHAMVTGVKEGWLDAKVYGPAARRAWLGLVHHLNASANVTNVCVGTGKAFQAVGPDLKAQVDYYLARPRSTGDLHGQAPILWSAAAFLR